MRNIKWFATLLGMLLLFCSVHTWAQESNSLQSNTSALKKGPAAITYVTATGTVFKGNSNTNWRKGKSRRVYNQEGKFVTFAKNGLYSIKCPVVNNSIFVRAQAKIQGFFKWKRYAGSRTVPYEPGKDIYLINVPTRKK